MSDVHYDEFFAQLDSNKDGLLTPMELRKAFGNRGVWVDEEAAIRFCSRYSESGSFNKDEFKVVWNRAIELWAKLDLNGDGIVDSEAFERNGLKAKEIIELVDANANGKISFVEFLFSMDLHAKNLKDAVAQLAAGTEFSMLLQSHPGDSARKVMVSAALAGIASKTMMAPLNRLVIMLQVSQPQTKMICLIRDIAQKEGLRGLFRGNGVSVFRLAPATAVHQSLYLKLKRQLILRGQFGVREEFLCGAIGGAVSMTATMPLDVIRTKMSVPESRGNMFLVGRKLIQREGIRGLWTGYFTALAEAVPFIGIQMVALEWFRPLIRRHLATRLSFKESVVTIGAASSASAISAVLTYPLVALRRNQQARRDHSLSRTAQIMWQSKGLRTFYKGLPLYLATVVPTITVALTTFEKLKQTLPEF